MTSAPDPLVTPLARHLAERITRDGPISVADYIDVCLQHPEHGYYRRQAAIGAAADFVTAPEISQVFGELIGLWCAVVWQQMGAPASLRLIELGPGRGTLMRDALRAARLVPAFRAALRVELVETNETLQQMQREALRNEDVPIAWGAKLTAADGPAIVIANEFLDTLPADQFVRRKAAWHMRCVGLDASGDLQFVDGPEAETDIPASLPAPSEGAIYEHRRTAFARLAEALTALGTPLAGLFIDYGHIEPNYGDTLQAILAHRYTDPLQTPGQADLTLQVDFTAFAHAVEAAGLRCDGPLPQAEFLGRLGAVERASRLMAANPARAAEIESGIARLLAPTGMGARFQVLGIRSVDVSPLPPFS